MTASFDHPDEGKAVDVIAHERAADTPRTPMKRLAPAITITILGFFIAVNTPMQLLLTVRLTTISGGADATTAFGIVTGVAALAALAFNPIAGRVSDRTRLRFGRRRTWIASGALAGSLVLVALGFATEVWQVVVLWSLVQITLNFQFAATNALIADQVPPGKQGGVSGMVGMSVALGPLIGLVLVNLAPTGSPVQWQIVALVLVVTAAVGIVLVRDAPAVRSTRASGGGLVQLLHTYWIDPRRHPAFGWAWAVRFLITCSFAATSYSTFFLLQRFGVTLEDLGSTVLTLSLLTVGMLAVSSVVAGFLSDRLRRQKPFVVAGGLLAAAGLLLLAFAPSLSFVFVSSSVLGLGVGTFFAVDLAMCIRVLPNGEDAGRDLAIINIANSLPQSLVPFIAPLLLAIGGYTALFGLLALFGVLGALASLRVPEVGHEHDPDSRAAPITRPTRSIPS